MNLPPFFVVATPSRSVCDNNARALAHAGYLRRYAVGQRRGPSDVPEELTRKLRLFGGVRRVGELVLPAFGAESFRFALHPWFDHWVKRQLQPGDHILSSYGYANASFGWVRRHGGKTYLDGGNSHPDHFWEILSEEHRRWNCSYPPVARHHYLRARAMMEEVDFVLSPSHFVTQSFLERGFLPDQIISSPYPVDLTRFTPSSEPRPRSRPLTVVSTGLLCLRKGTPYLLEAFRLVLKKYPNARLRLIQVVHDNIRPILARYSDLPIDWSPPMGHKDLAEYLRQADIFVLPSLEEGLARTACEAMACGLPVILTPNTGANDFVQPGVNGEVVPIRDAGALAEAVLKWADTVMQSSGPSPRRLPHPEQFSFDFFQRQFLAALVEKKIIPSVQNGPGMPC
jgi:glycosyltransferase involved in cell wall biosynthesis